ncbi:ankyrin repeat-containing domain protein [Paraphoma chrysanthemicola]|nr:ankyrin repeat-containing domain protein [Paraphoma chrysanthemicola]
MRLLRLHGDGHITSTEYYSHIPPYAILSHTWGTDEEEVSFKDLNDGMARQKKGYSKLSFCGRQAAADGIEHFWVDTCSIDKSSSAELSEAINSMFKWYQNSERCYVYLTDVATDAARWAQSGSQWEHDFRKSRWFTRGWTLQELLAPKVVQFFSREGHTLGDKASLMHILHDITGIGVDALQGGSLGNLSIEERLSWSKVRTTKREEDAVYCLLGLFDVYMPPIYGEGREKAFTRLKRELYEGSKDLITDSPVIDLARDTSWGRLRHWLSAPDPSANFQQALKQRQAETGSWLLESKHYEAWMSSAPSFLWLYGIPGSGKTVLSSAVLQYVKAVCQNETNSAVTYFYFDFKDSQKQYTESMLRSMVDQLAQQSANLPSRLKDLYVMHDHGKRQPTLDSLLNLVRELAQGIHHIYIVLDALDECSQRPELLEVISIMAQWPSGNTHILVTSRRERDLESSLEDLGDRENSICLTSKVVDDDIRKYVRQRLADDKTLSKWGKDTVLKAEIETALMQGSQGMFRWAVCQLDLLRKCRNRALLRKSLATLPPTLDKTYEVILANISEDDSMYAKRILRWLTFADRPFTLDAIAEVIAIDVNREPCFDEEEILEDSLEVLDICSGLVRIATEVVDDEIGLTRQVVTLAHYSVKEYLMSERIHFGPVAQYGLHLHLGHSMMANACLGYLLQFQQAKLSKDLLHYRHLARYTAAFWMSHARRSGSYVVETMAMAVRLMSFDNPAYHNWIRIRECDVSQSWEEPILNLSIPDGPLPLYNAALFGIPELVKLLIDRGDDVNETSGLYGAAYGTALQAAASEGNEEVVLLLLANGADIDGCSSFHGSALQASSKHGHEQIVSVLLDNGADVNTRGGLHSSALGSASMYNRATIVKRLLDAGADVTITDFRGRPPLMYAAQMGYFDIVKELVQYGADVEVVDGGGYTPLLCASERGHLEIVNFFIDCGAKVSVKNSNGWAPLTFASESGFTEVVALLLNEGVDMATTYSGGRTAFIAAASSGHLDVVKLFLRRPETRINSVNGRGRTALFCATMNNHISIVELLLSFGAEPRLQDVYGESAMSQAASCGYNSVLECLLAAPGMDPNGKDQYDRTLLWWAAASGQEATVAMLINKYKGDTNIADKSGRTPLTIALKNGHSSMRKLLLSEDNEDFKGDLDHYSSLGDLNDQSDIQCDICTRGIPDAEPHYHCSECANGDWDICEDCRDTGLTCMDAAHELSKRTKALGVWVDVA